MKKIFKILFIAFIVISQVACNNQNSNYSASSTGTAEYLFNLRTPYIGDNTAVGRLLNALDIRNYGHYTFELKTSEEPYALIINYSLVEGNGPITKEAMIKKSTKLLALINNADEIHWTFPDNATNIITLQDLYIDFGNIKDYGRTIEDFRRLLHRHGFHEEPITFSVKNLTNSGLTLIIENNTANEYLYGEPFSLYHRLNNVWTEVKQIELCAFTSQGIILTANANVQREYNWTWCHGILPRGEYRITKTFMRIHSNPGGEWEFGNTYYISAEFTLT